MTDAAPDVLLPNLEESRKGFRELMRNGEFRLIWASQVASQLADKFLVYSLLTVSRLRPLARRRFSTSRPFFVLIRTRNPWVRFRWRVLG